MSEKDYRKARSLQQEDLPSNEQLNNSVQQNGAHKNGAHQNIVQQSGVRQNAARQSSTHQNTAHQSVSQYSRNRYVTKKRRSPLPFIIVLIVIALVLAAFFIIKSFVIDNNFGNTNAANQTNTAQTASTTQAPDGRIVMTICGSEKTILKRGEKYIESGCTARDSQQGNISDTVQISGSVDENTAGKYTITYTATNSENMSNQATREVEVVDDYAWDTDGISVMMYHYVYPDNDPPEKSDANLLPASQFEAQLQWLTEENYYYPSFKELRAFIDGNHSLPAKSVILTFDDGDSTFFDVVKPLAEKYKVPVTGFIIGNRENIAETVKANASPYVDYESHSYAMHEDGTKNIGRGGAIYDFSVEDVTHDCEQERGIIGNFNAFAYPYGDISDIAPNALAENGVETAFSIVYGQVHPGDDPMRLKRMRVFGEGSLSGYKYQVEKGPES